MPAYNTDAVVVDPVNHSRSGGLPPETPLAFDLSGKLYLGYYRTGASGNKAGIFRSSDDGATWDEPDTANAPSIGNQSASYASFGTVIYCAHVDGSLGSNWVIDQFDTVADRYGTQLNLGINLFTDHVLFLLLKIDSVGDQYVIYEKYILTGPDITGKQIYFRKIIACVIGAETLLTTSHTTSEIATMECLTVDETDRVHVCFSVSAFAPGFQNGQPKDYFWTSISSAEVMAAEVLLTTIASSYPDYMGPEPAVYLGQLIVFGRDAAGLIVTHTCATGTDTPTFADAALGFASVASTATNSWPEMRPVVSDGTLYVFYIRYEPNLVDPFAELTDQINIISTPDGATWTGPGVWWNEAAHPVNPGQFEQALAFLHAIPHGTDFLVQTNAFIGFGSGVGIVMVGPITGGFAVARNYCF